jgi:hypothetical protein
MWNKKLLCDNTLRSGSSGFQWDFSGESNTVINSELHNLSSGINKYPIKTFLHPYICNIRKHCDGEKYPFRHCNGFTHYQLTWIWGGFWDCCFFVFMRDWLDIFYSYSVFKSLSIRRLCPMKIHILAKKIWALEMGPKTVKLWFSRKRLKRFWLNITNLWRTSHKLKHLRWYLQEKNGMPPRGSSGCMRKYT